MSSSESLEQRMTRLETGSGGATLFPRLQLSAKASGKAVVLEANSTRGANIQIADRSRSQTLSSAKTESR